MAEVLHNIRMASIDMGTSGKLDTTRYTGPKALTTKPNTTKLAFGESVGIRRKRVSAYWNTITPDIVFAQQMGAYSKDKWRLDIDVNSYNFTKDNKHVGLAYNRERFDLIRHINEKALQTIDQKRGVVFGERERLCAAILQSRESNLKILCISWHGKHMRERETDGRRPSRQSIREKRERLRPFLDYVQALGREYKQFHDIVVIGGNFNLKPMELVLQHQCYTVLFPRIVPGNIGFLVSRPPYGVLSTPETGNYGVNKQGEPGYLHHRPIHIVLEFVTRQNAIAG